MRVKPPPFAEQMRDLSIDPAVFQERLRASRPPRRLYGVMFTARSGSSWLTSVLSGTGLLGYPEEYLNPEFIRDIAAYLNTAEPGLFLTALTRHRQTPNGIFGMEVRALDIRLFGAAAFFEFFDQSTLFFNLRRENIVAQAISLHRAVTTKRFHSHDPEAANQLPAYDEQAIADCLWHLALEENENVIMLRERGQKFVDLSYEDIVLNRDATLKRFADAMDVTLPPEMYGATRPAELKKIGDDWNLQAEQTFRRQNAAFLSEIEAHRMAKTP